MASKSAYQAQEKGAEIEEQLDQLEKLIDRLRVMYEQYFLGISKLAPAQLHTEAERRIRDVTQLQIKNTGLRYRFATLSQKFGAYNSYWKRTMRQIEQGRYVRDLQRVGRKAARTGDDIPEEILQAMPKLMRERVKRDRAAAEAIARRQGKLDAAAAAAAGDADDGAETGELEATAARAPARSPGNVHRIDSLLDDDVDIDDLFASLTEEAEQAVSRTPPAPPPRPPRARSTDADETHDEPVRGGHDFDPPTERNAPPVAPPPPDGRRRCRRPRRRCARPR
ncbi:MAG: hypothetical protein H6709_05875 [Kofleriaceae bacterium]|nr:hypothetical protein [Kofleriaceae bacterium]